MEDIKKFIWKRARFLFKKGTQKAKKFFETEETKRTSRRMNKFYFTQRRKKMQTLQNLVHVKSETTWNAECHYFKGGINYDFMCQSITFGWKKQEKRFSPYNSRNCLIVKLEEYLKMTKPHKHPLYIIFKNSAHPCEDFSVKIEVKYVSIHQIAGISLVRLWQLN